MPACAGDSEEVHVVANVAKDVKGCMVLEEEIHLDTDAADVLEHVRELHVLGIRAESIEAVDMLVLLADCCCVGDSHIMIINLADIRNLRK